jgi:hypothetical protein
MLTKHTTTIVEHVTQDCDIYLFFFQTGLHHKFCFQILSNPTAYLHLEFNLLVLPAHHCLSGQLHHADVFLLLCSQQTKTKKVAASKYFSVPIIKSNLWNKQDCNTWHVPRISLTVPSIFLDMDLSLIVLAMFKTSSKARLPLCLTESNYTITLLDGKQNATV